MKTIREWLEELPEPYRSQALENMDIEDADIEHDNFERALCGAFLWMDSPEGWDYWNKIRNGKFPKEAVIKSNREIAEEIFAEIFRSKTADLYTNINSIESILNKYIKQ